MVSTGVESLNSQSLLTNGREAKQLLGTINADYDVVAEAEAILANASLVSV